MYRYLKISLFILSSSLVACDDLITVEVEEKDPLLVVDAFINDADQEQKIVIAWTQPYFDETAILGIDNATVEVSYGDPATTVTFTHTDNGSYVYPTGFGSIGDEFELHVTLDGKSYVAQSVLNPVPVMDSVNFRYEHFTAFGYDEEFYLGQFWATDLEGEGDCYWIKSYKNGEYQNSLDMVTLAYDAAFSAGSAVDGLTFIVPIRESINDYGDDDEDFISPFEDGDSLYVEIHSITEEVFDYLTLAISNTNLPSGFGALFASPSSNTYGNVYPADPNSDEVVLGCFSVSAVSGGGSTLDISQVPKEE